MWENYKGSFKLPILQSPPGILKISRTKNGKIFMPINFLLFFFYREDRSFSWRYGLKNSTDLFAVFIHTWQNVWLEKYWTARKTSVFSSGLFVLSTQCGSETLWLGYPPENLCDRSAFGFALWNIALFYFFLQTFFFLYKSEFLV